MLMLSPVSVLLGLQTKGCLTLLLFGFHQPHRSGSIVICPFEKTTSHQERRAGRAAMPPFHSDRNYLAANRSRGNAEKRSVGRC